MIYKDQTPSAQKFVGGDKGFRINKKGLIETVGAVEESLPAATFRIILDNGFPILAKLSGRMRRNRITLMPGDRVKVEMSQYDLTKGRITYRL